MADKARIAILISGAGTNMAALVYASRIADCPYEVVLVAANDPAAGGLALAQAEGIPTFALPHKGMTREAHDAAMEAAVLAAGADHIVLAGYMRILSDGFVQRWAGRMLNIHPSLLPLYKGLDTHARAIAAGESHGGTSVHLVTPELDAGEVLAQIAVPIVPGDTPATLAERVKHAEHQLYPRAVADYVSRWRNPSWLLAQLRARALALPETSEQKSFGSAGFRVGGSKSGKYFAYFSERPHGHERIALLVKTSGMDELHALIEDQPDIYFKPAFYGASGWVGIVLDRPDLDWGDIETWLQRSWRSVAPKRLTRLMNIADQF
ncbi:phosphoribosylglycinamide formyltransferase [Erythrobacter tepidarius]|uniref:phosphoribosylglycinamide formyltransferase n=1 Tax=Erythrobacter tepidarius TaxID=60454 RepID=UPI000A3682D2|nr:phosphoribosylglycinamide formyltransferase [Erythrobacter tepidarius]